MYTHAEGVMLRTATYKVKAGWLAHQLGGDTTDGYDIEGIGFDIKELLSRGLIEPVPQDVVPPENERGDSDGTESALSRSPTSPDQLLNRPSINQRRVRRKQ